MKRTKFAAAFLLLAFSGCGCGQGWSWRPQILSRFHDKIHGTNVGAPCMSGACSAPAMAAPAMVDAGCETCNQGTQSMGYEGFPTPNYSGAVIGNAYEGSVPTGTVYSGEVVPSVRAQ